MMSFVYRCQRVKAVAMVLTVANGVRTALKSHAADVARLI
jgi:hypothetical protein